MMLLSASTLVVWTAKAGLTLMSVALLLSLVRLVVGPTLPDRVVALDLVALLLVAMLALYGIAEREPESMRVATVLALINFLATIGFAVYVRRKAAQ